MTANPRSGILFIGFSSVAFAHHEVQTAEDRRPRRSSCAGQQLRQDAEVHERGRANLQPVRHAAALAVDVKAQLALRILRAEINFARRRIDALP